MTFEFVKIPYGCKLRCVYMMSFDTGKFYIGGTQNLKYRMGAWKSNVLRGDTISPLVNLEVCKCKVISFSVLEIVPDDVDIFSVETKYLQKYLHDPMNLNISKCSRRLRTPMTKEQIIHRSIQTGRTHRIAKYDSDWNLMHVWDTLAEACEYNKRRTTEVREVLNGKKRKYKGCYYRRLDLNMNPIHPIQTLRKTNKNKGVPLQYATKQKMNKTLLERKAKGLVNIEKRVPIEAWDMNGLLFKRYDSVRLAAQDIGGNSTNI